MHMSVCLPKFQSANREEEAAANDLHCVDCRAGAACHAAEPGFFRMCWAWPHPGSIPTAVQRLQAAIKQFRQRDVLPAVEQLQKVQL